MNSTGATIPEDSSFRSLTDKQREVLDLLAENRTTKEIAAQLHVSDSAVNQRIEPLRQRLGGVSRAELTRRYRSFAGVGRVLDTCEVLTAEKLQVETIDGVAQTTAWDNRPGHYRFDDSLSFVHEPPWLQRPELWIVPRLLDGKHAGLARGITMLLMLLLIVVCLVLGLTAAQVLTETLDGRRPATSTMQ